MPLLEPLTTKMLLNLEIPKSSIIFGGHQDNFKPAYFFLSFFLRKDFERNNDFEQKHVISKI